MDRIDKVLLILPFLPLADLTSTLFSLTFDGQEVGIVAKSIYQQYRESGLVAWSCFLFLIFLACVWILRIGKRRLIRGQASKRERRVLVVTVYVFFAAEALWTPVVIQNFLVPISLSLFVTLARMQIWSLITFAYFVMVSFYTRAEMRHLINARF